MIGDISLDVLDSYCESEIFSEEKKCLISKNDGLSFLEEDSHPLRIVLYHAMGDKRLARKIHNVLEQRGLDRYEKKLGRGFFGSVIQLDGTDLYKGEKLALKLIAPDTNSAFIESCRAFGSDSNDYSSSTSFTGREVSWIDLSKSFGCSNSTQLSESGITKPSNLVSQAWAISRIAKDRIIGDGLALNFPHDRLLLPAYGLLLYDGKEVKYVESVDFIKHQGMAVIGMVSPVASGGSLAGRVGKSTFTLEEVKRYGKYLAQAIHDLHEQGYAHRDIHMGNILLNGDSPNTYPLQLADFGLSRKLSKDSALYDWFDYLDVMEDLLAMCDTNKCERILSIEEFQKLAKD